MALVDRVVSMVQAVGADIKALFASRTLVYGPSGLVGATKVFVATATTNASGAFTFSYGHVGFTQILGISLTSEAVGTAAGDRTVVSISQGGPTLAACSGAVMTSTGAGLLVGFALTNANAAKVHIVVWGS